MADLNEQALLEKAENERDKSLYEYAQKSVKGTYEFAKYLNSPSFKRHMRQMANRSGEAAKKLADDFKNMNSEAKKCLAMSFVPYAGDSMDVYEVSTGLDACTGEKLSEEQRRISMAATLFGSGAFMRKVAESLGWIKNGAGGLSASKVEDVVNETSELYTDIAKVVGKDRAREVYNSSKKMGMSKADDLQTLAKTADKISQRQGRHLKGHRDYGGKSYLESLEDAKTVLNDYKSGKVQFLGRTSEGHVVIKHPSVRGTNVNTGAGFPSQSTVVFYVKGTAKPSIVPYNPNWKP